MTPITYKAKLVVYKGKQGVLLFFKVKEDARKAYLFLSNNTELAPYLQKHPLLWLKRVEVIDNLTPFIAVVVKDLPLALSIEGIKDLILTQAKVREVINIE